MYNGLSQIFLFQTRRKNPLAYKGLLKKKFLRFIRSIFFCNFRLFKGIYLSKAHILASNVSCINFIKETDTFGHIVV